MVLKTDVQDRLNGMDQDSDSVYVTNQEQIVEAAKVAYAKYPTIVNNIPLEGASIYKNDSESYALMDSKISSAQMSIGYSSNLAQMALRVIIMINIIGRMINHLNWKTYL